MSDRSPPRRQALPPARPRHRQQKTAVRRRPEAPDTTQVSTGQNRTGCSISGFSEGAQPPFSNQTVQRYNPWESSPFPYPALYYSKDLQENPVFSQKFPAIIFGSPVFCWEFQIFSIFTAPALERTSFRRTNSAHFFVFSGKNQLFKDLAVEFLPGFALQ